MSERLESTEELHDELKQLRRRVAELEAAEHGGAEESLRWLSESAMEFVTLPPDRDIYDFIGRKVKQLVGRAIVSVNSIDEEKCVLRVRSLSGLKQSTLERTEQLLGRRVLDTDFDGVHEEAKTKLTGGSLQELEGRFYQMFFERVPKPVCLALEKLLGVQSVHSIGLRRKGRLFGNLTVIALKGARLNKDALETFASQASAALEHRQTNAALRESEARHRLIAENVTDFVWTAKIEGLDELTLEAVTHADDAMADELLGRWQFTFVSPSVERILGYRPEEMMSRRIDAILSPESYARVKSQFLNELVTALTDPDYTHDQVPLELELVTGDGGLCWGELTRRFLRDEQNRVFGTLGVVRDVSERKRSEDALRQERDRLGRLLDMHERDRKLVAYEIHDGFVPPLTAALMQLEGHWRELKAGPSPASDESCCTAIRLLRDAIADARRLMGGLRPPVLDEFGVIAAITSLVECCRSDGSPEIVFVHNNRLDRLAPPLETAVFRIVQEGLANALRHSGSSRVRIRLDGRENRLRIEVQDWGAGFDPSLVEGGRFGLEGIRERARIFDGRATIDSAPGRGTRITVELPLVEAGAGELGV
jgi:PAS domain S-box-containing protein